MKPPAFAYHAPATIEEALALLAELPNAKLLAGGQSLMPMLNMRFAFPDHLIDLNRIPALSGIRREGDTVWIGAMTRQRALEDSPVIREDLPLMIEALEHVGHRQTRNRGTIGGSLCHLDPAAELVCVAAALDASIEIKGPRGSRNLLFAEFPLGFMAPAIEADELVTGLRFAASPPGSGHAFLEFARRHGDFAIVSATAMLSVSPDGRIEKAVLALGGVDAVPRRQHAIERMLIGRAVDPALFETVAAALDGIAAMDDAHVPAWYRQHLAKVLTKRALARAWERCRHD